MAQWWLSSQADRRERTYGILVVENDAIIKDAITRALHPWAQFEVHTATTGMEAIAKSATQHYDLVILAYHLPDMDGKTVFRTLCKKRPVCALALSADPRASREQLRTEGFADCLLKPFTTADLREHVQNLCPGT